MKRNPILLTLFILPILLGFAFCESKTENSSDEYQDMSSPELIKLINDYRESLGLSRIASSPSLNKVASIHVQDLMYNNPLTKECNLHSWSDKGKWSPCCYTRNHKSASCMWDKPRELTSYTGDGFEIAAASSFKITPADALSLWKDSPGHHKVIINEGIWKRYEWKAIGAAVFKNYAVVWFGAVEDD